MSEKGAVVEDPMKHFWQIRLQEMKEILEANNFSVFNAEDAESARRMVLEEILPACRARSLSYGGSLTMRELGLHALLSDDQCGFEVIRADEPGISLEEKLERRRQALLVDLYISGVNALTEEGHLVNLDMIGNRVGAITFGPKNVLLLIGRNKIVPDLEAAMSRIKNFSAPINAMRLDCKTPCVKTSHCADCRSPGRICNTWTITEKSYPKGRIKVVLINENLGI